MHKPGISIDKDAADPTKKNIVIDLGTVSCSDSAGLSRALQNADLEADAFFLKLNEWKEDRTDVKLTINQASSLSSLLPFVTTSTNPRIDPAKDPWHPQLTTMQKLEKYWKSGSKNSLHLDSEESCYLATKILDRFPEELRKTASNGCELSKLGCKTTFNVTNGSVKNTTDTGGNVPSKSDIKNLKPNVTTNRRASAPAAAASFESIDAILDRVLSQFPQALDSGSLQKLKVLQTEGIKAVLMAVLGRQFPKLLEARPSKSCSANHFLTFLEDGCNALKNEITVVTKKKDQEFKLMRSSLENKIAELGAKEEHTRASEQEAYALLQTKKKKAVADLEVKLVDLKLQADADVKYERIANAELKREFSQKISDLEKQVQTGQNNLQKAEAKISKQKELGLLNLQKFKSQRADLKADLDRKTEELNIQKLDYEATCDDLKALKADHSNGFKDKEAKYQAQEQELAALRSKRTNPQVERDNLDRAVREAVLKELDKKQKQLLALQNVKNKEVENLNKKMAGLQNELDLSQIATGKLLSKYQVEKNTSDELQDELSNKNAIIASLQEFSITDSSPSRTDTSSDYGKSYISKHYSPDTTIDSYHSALAEERTKLTLLRTDFEAAQNKNIMLEDRCARLVTWAGGLGIQAASIVHHPERW